MHFSSGFLCELKQNSVLSKCPYSQLRAATDPVTDFLKVAEHWEPGARGVGVGRGGAHRWSSRCLPADTLYT